MTNPKWSTRHIESKKDCKLSRGTNGSSVTWNAKSYDAGPRKKLRGGERSNKHRGRRKRSALDWNGSDNKRGNDQVTRPGLSERSTKPTIVTGRDYERKLMVAAHLTEGTHFHLLRSMRQLLPRNAKLPRPTLAAQTKQDCRQIRTAPATGAIRKNHSN